MEGGREDEDAAESGMAEDGVGHCAWEERQKGEWIGQLSRMEVRRGGRRESPDSGEDVGPRGSGGEESGA